MTTMDEKFTAQELTETLPDLSSSEKPPRLDWGPGFLNIAIPDRGHIQNCRAKTFRSQRDGTGAILSEAAEEVNAWCELPENQGNLIVLWSADSTGAITIVYGKLTSDDTREEIDHINRVIEMERTKFREAKAKAKAETDRLVAEAKEAADELTRVGLACKEKHGAIVADLPGIPKTKTIRRSIADELIKWAETNNLDTGFITKLLRRFEKGEK